jgi:hypothetical protein
MPYLGRLDHARLSDVVESILHRAKVYITAAG